MVGACDDVEMTFVGRGLLPPTAAQFAAIITKGLTPKKRRSRNKGSVK